MNEPLSWIRPPRSSQVGVTLREHILAGMHASKGATGEFTSLLNHISLAVRIVSARVRSSGLADLLGYTGETNVQGEAVQKLDTLANDTMVQMLARSGHCGLIASEEIDDAVFAEHPGKYAVLFDPLDGSSNIDVNVTIGTIFAILLRRHPDAPATVADALRPGRELVAAGYAAYGPSTELVIATQHGVDAFVLDPSVGEFFLSRANIRIPARGKLYSCNEGNASMWSPPVQKWAAWIKGDNGEGTPYGHRYTGSLVADAHRTLIKGGIFAYPADAKNKNGKLRLLYEVNPIAYIIEKAGGAATNGIDPVLDLIPSEIHQRSPFVFGSSEDVTCFAQFARGER